MCICYLFSQSQEPYLYIIRKQNRESPTSVIPLATYYCLNGNVYKVIDFLLHRDAFYSFLSLLTLTHLQKVKGHKRWFVFIVTHFSFSKRLKYEYIITIIIHNSYFEGY